MYRGGTIEIPLQATGRTPTPIKFLIRDQPKAGSLGGIQRMGRTSATVRYTHDYNSGPGTDFFTYAVQAMDSPVSARGRIQITITEAPPVLSVVPEMNFGRTMIGKTKVQEIMLTNSGGGVLSGVVQVQAPWSILGPANFWLTRSQSKKIRLAFTPTEEREYSERLIFSHDTRLGVTLQGFAASPFSYLPAQGLELAATADSPIKSATLRITNNSDSDRILRMTASEGMVVDSTVTVPAEGEASITVQTKPDVFAALEGKLELKGEEYEHSMPIRAFSTPPLVSITPPEGFDFGTIKEGQEFTGSLTIKNSGGTEARMKASLPLDVRTAPDLASASIPAGEVVTFKILGEPRSPGAYEKTMVIEVENGKAYSFSLSGSVTPRPQSQVMREEIATLPDKTPLTDTVWLESGTMAHTLPLKNLTPFKVGLRELEIAWDKPPNVVIQRYLVQGRQLEPVKDGPPKSIWTEWSGVRFRESADGKSIIARFAHLPFNGMWAIRIVGIDDNEVSLESGVIRLTSPPSPKNHLVEFFFIVAGLVVLIVGFMIYRRRRRDAIRHESDQIARLEKRE